MARKYGDNENSVKNKIQRAGYNETDVKNIITIIKEKNFQFSTPVLFASRYYVGSGVNYNTFFFSGEGSLPEGIKQNNFTPFFNIGIDIFLISIPKNFISKAS